MIKKALPSLKKIEMLWGEDMKITGEYKIKDTGEIHIRGREQTMPLSSQ